MEESPVLRVFATAVLVVTATFAYFSAPLLAFADAGTIAIAVSLLGMGAAGSWLAVRQDWGRWWLWPYAAVALVGALLLTHEINRTSTLYGHNQKRCANIQRDMLSPTPRRPDGPDLFQALGCRPQGSEDVHFPARLGTPSQRGQLDQSGEVQPQSPTPALRGQAGPKGAARPVR
jgi:hypothetical protein